MYDVVLGSAVVGADILGILGVLFAESGCVPLAFADNVLALLNAALVAVLAVFFLAVVFAVPGSNDDSHEFETDAVLQQEPVSFVHYYTLVVVLEIGAVDVPVFAAPDTAGVISDFLLGAVNVAGNCIDGVHYKHRLVPDTTDAALCSLAAVLHMSGADFAALDNSVVLVNCSLAVAAGDSVVLAGSSVADGNIVALVGNSAVSGSFVVGLHNFALADAAQTPAALLLHELTEQLPQISLQSDFWQSK